MGDIFEKCLGHGISISMKKISLLTFGLSLISLTLFATAKPREVTLETKKIKEAVHWTPEKVEVSSGETVKFVVKHELEGGFDFHGFFIPALNIAEQVERNKPKTIEVKIPGSLKPGEYPIGCQFHPKHVAAVLIVKPASKSQ